MENPNEKERKLSDRELEVLGMIANEHTNKDIAIALEISVYTVETHRKNMIRKMGTRNIIGVLNKAFKNGWLP